jgi:hypothetical protein
MNKINTLVLLIHPLWNKLIFKEPNINDPIKIYTLLKNPEFRASVKSQITTYANTIKNLASRNKNSHIIIIFPGEDIFLNKSNNKIESDIYSKRIKESWEILFKYFKTKLKRITNLDINTYHPSIDIKKDDFLKKVSFKPEQLSRNLRIISFGEQYSKKEEFCVNMWTNRIKQVLKKQKINVEVQIIENATLKPKENFRKKIKTLQKRKTFKRK